MNNAPCSPTRTRSPRYVVGFFALIVIAFSLSNQTFAQNRNSNQPILFDSWSRPNSSTPNSIQISDNRVARAAGTVAMRVVPNNRPRVSRVPRLAASSLERQAFDAINDQRREQGLPPLAFDAEMLYIARQHSQAMADENFFNHRDGSGQMVNGRANAAGIVWQSIGENIAMNQGFKDSVAVAAKSWKNSKKHRDNILNENWNRTAVGVAVTPDGKAYFTQVFALR